MAISAGGRIVIAYENYGVSYVISDDGGRTFSKPQALEHTWSDPVLAALADGSFVLGGTGVYFEQSDQKLHLSRLGKGQTSVGQLGVIDDREGGLVHPWVHAKNDGFTTVASYVTQGGYGISSWRPQEDLVLSFPRTDIAPVSNPPITLFPHFCNGNGNRIAVHFLDQDSPSRGRIVFGDGETWPVQAMPSESGFITTGACAVNGDKIWALLGTSDGVTPSAYVDLAVLASIDGGKTWTKTATLSEAGSMYLRPQLIAEANGTLDVVTYLGPGPTNTARLAVVHVADERAPEVPIVLVSGLKFDPDGIENFGAVGLVENQPAFAFVDTRGSSPRIRFAVLR